jgi:hypothetical protein
MPWWKRKYGDLALRLAGLLLLCLAALIGRCLFAAPDAAAKDEPVAYLLGLIGMSSMSAGAALMVLGRHLFDQVNLPPRWRIHNPQRRRD